MIWLVRNWNDTSDFLLMPMILMYHTCSINCCCSVSSRLALPQATTDEPAGTSNEMNLKLPGSPLFVLLLKLLLARRQCTRCYSHTFIYYYYGLGIAAAIALQLLPSEQAVMDAAVLWKGGTSKRERHCGFLDRPVADHADRQTDRQTHKQGDNSS